MKNRQSILILIISLVLALLGSSCSLTQAQKDTLTQNALKDANAALVGGLSTGTWEGAAAGAMAQALKNHLPAAKNPVRVTP